MPTSTELVDQIQTVLDQLRTSVFVPPVVVPPVESVTVSSAAELQTALDGPVPLVLVKPGEYRGSFKLKVKATPTVVQGLVPGAAWTLVPGVPTAAVPFPAPVAVPNTTFPKIIAANPLLPAIATEFGAHDYSFNGLEVTGVDPSRNMIEIGVGASLLEQLPQRITFERMWVHGTVPPFGHRGLFFDVREGIVRDSLFTDFVEVGRDSQAIGIAQGSGFLIERNWMEASGENMMVGGSDPKIPGMIPSNGLVRFNTFFKPQSYRLYARSVKNLFELKNAANWTVTDNIFDSVWADAQSGHAVLFNVRNQSGAAPWCNITDLLFSRNIIRNVSAYAINILGTDNNFPSGTSKNMVITQNLLQTIGYGILISGGTDYTIDDNVMVDFHGPNSTFLAINSPLAVPGVKMRGNRLGLTAYGLGGNGTVAYGAASFTKAAPDGIFTGNSLERKGTWPVYPAGNTMLPEGTVKAEDWPLG